MTLCTLNPVLTTYSLGSASSGILDAPESFALRCFADYEADRSIRPRWSPVVINNSRIEILKADQVEPRPRLQKLGRADVRQAGTGAQKRLPDDEAFRL